MRYILQGQYPEWKADKRKSFLWGAISSTLAWVAIFSSLVGILFFSYLPSREGRIKNLFSQEIDVKDQRIESQKSELMDMIGLVTATFGKDTAVVIEGYKKAKRGKAK